MFTVNNKNTRTTSVMCYDSYKKRDCFISEVFIATQESNILMVLKYQNSYKNYFCCHL